MRRVLYSILPDAQGRYAAQWRRSVESLRRHNARIAITAVIYDAIPATIESIARRFDVQLADGGRYEDMLAGIAPEWASGLRFFPTLHKVPSLRHLDDAGLRQVLYLDCDTWFFADVERIFEENAGAEWYAREEPRSRRSPYPYDPAYLDETALRRLARVEHLEFVPPYNTGVILLNDGLWAALGCLSRDLLEIAGRLLLDVAARPLPPFLDGIDRTSLQSARGGPLAFPSSNEWILEAVATWLTLGRISRLRHEMFPAAHVLQNGEFRTASTLPVLVHYFSGLEREFFASINQDGRAGAAN